MTPNTPYQQVEIFHLLFLRHLEAKLDKSMYAVKGGCNLRFFMKSIRYSGDLDIDVRTVARPTLEKKIAGILGAPGLRATLQSKGIEVTGWTASKQTDTTQRWKIQLKVANSALPLPTKIEFSRRRFEKEAELGPVEPELIQAYQLYPILCSHYGKNAACRQKLAALQGRTEVQARDVFDLHLLIDQDANPKPLESELKSKIKQIEEIVMGIGFAAFTSQVVSYLSMEYQEYYRSQKVWSNMQDKVLRAVRGWV
jgi:predicted nucleotidyltransferase component of viral defense system